MNERKRSTADWERPGSPRPPVRTPRWNFGATLRSQHGFVGAVDSIYADYWSARCCGIVPAKWFEDQRIPPSTKDQVFYGLVALDGVGAVLVGEREAEAIP